LWESFGAELKALVDQVRYFSFTAMDFAGRALMSFSISAIWAIKRSAGVRGRPTQRRPGFHLRKWFFEH
jgi:hypothetical protein